MTPRHERRKRESLELEDTRNSGFSSPAAALRRPGHEGTRAHGQRTPWNEQPTAVNMLGKVVTGALICSNLELGTMNQDHKGDPRPDLVHGPSKTQEKELKSGTKPGLRIKFHWRQLFKIRLRKKIKASMRNFFTIKRSKVKTKIQPKNGVKCVQVKESLRPKNKISQLFKSKMKVKIQQKEKVAMKSTRPELKTEHFPQLFVQKSLKENVVNEKNLKQKPKPESKTRLEPAIRSVLFFIGIILVSEMLGFCVMQLFWCFIT